MTITTDSTPDSFAQNWSNVFLLSLCTIQTDAGPFVPCEYTILQNTSLNVDDFLTEKSKSYTKSGTTYFRLRRYYTVPNETNFVVMYLASRRRPSLGNP